MQGPDYPVSYFRLMAAISAQLAAMSIQMLEQQYAYYVFGSWLFSFENAKGVFRIVFDGKESELSLEIHKSPDHQVWNSSWKRLLTVGHVNLKNSAEMMEVVMSLIDKAV